MSEPITAAVISKWAVMSLWAAFGGIVHALTEKRRGGVHSFADGVILAFVSGFAGMMWGLGAMKFYPNDMLVIAFASGLGGFMSLEGIAVLINYLKNKSGIK